MSGFVPTPVNGYCLKTSFFDKRSELFYRWIWAFFLFVFVQ